MNWSELVFGTYSPQQIQWAVKRDNWQSLRITMLKEPLERKYEILLEWLKVNKHSLVSRVQVTNYVNALKRGGLIK